jgi:PKD repeat protein
VSCPGVLGPTTLAVRGAVIDKDGGDRYINATVQVLAPNTAPTVSLTGPADGASFNAPATITLAATASDVDGNLARFDFLSEGTVVGSATASPYSFSWSGVAEGTYTLTARAVDAAGATTLSNAVRVNVVRPNTPPVANPGGPYQGTEGVALTLDGRASSDPDGDALTYAWDFGDGSTGSGASVAKTYADNGSYTVTLVVSDASGGRHSASTTVTVVNVTPTGTLAAPASVASGAAYTLSITGAADVAADLPGLEYHFDCGAGFGAWATASSASCAGVTGPTTRSVRGAVRDKDGGMREFTASVDVLAPPNRAPTVSLTAPSDGATFTAPATITITAAAADVDGNLVRVEFLNGGTVVGSATASPYSFTATNVPAGTYTVTARAIDGDGATTTSAAVRVIVNTPPRANLGGPYNGTEGIALTFNGGGSSDPDGDALTYAWDFGDGTTSTERSPSKVYEDDEIYTVTLVVTDPSGASHTASTTATIANVAPTGTFVAPQSVYRGATYTLSINNVNDVPADLAHLLYRFDCGSGWSSWSSASSVTCPGTWTAGSRTVRGAVRDKEDGLRQFTATIEVLRRPE